MSSQVLIATRKGLFLAEKNNSNWNIEKAMLLGDPITMVLVDQSNNWHAAVEHGHFGVKLKRSSDMGNTWEEIATPEYPHKPDGVEDIDPIRQTPIPWSLMKVWSMENGVSDSTNTIWCGTIPGGLFRSRDCGESWEFIESLWMHPDKKKMDGRWGRLSWDSFN